VVGDRAFPLLARRQFMARGSDPAADPRADYDYRGPGGDDDLAAALEEAITGDVRFDDYSRTLYATDASAYEVTPVGVVLPASTADVATVVKTCAQRGVAVLPRGGGTSLAGQAVNEAVVLDFTRYMDTVREVDPGSRTATAEPGVVLADLDAAAADHGLTFAPDPAWGDKSALGGAIGNNSTGAHSLVYGKTDAYVEEVEAVLADGTVTTFGERDIEDLRATADPDGDRRARIDAMVCRIIEEDADAIRDAFPDLHRNVSGYNLDRLVEEAADGTVNLARLLCGSEGTLAVVTEATVSLEPTPSTKAVALLSYPSLDAALHDVAPILEHDPAAVEVLDDVLLGLARETQAFADLVAELPAGTDSLLLVEFFADDDAAGRRKVGALLADRVPDADPVAATVPETPRTSAEPRAVAGLEAHDQAARDRFWSLRKAGLPILLSRTTDEKHVSFIEDTAVPPDRLPDYVEDLEAVLAAHDTFAAYYAHAGPGVLHVRPLINTKTDAGVDRLASIADAVTDLVVEYGGSVSGEHGDGRARTAWNRKLYGDRVLAVFRDLKTAFDPDWLLNPGQVCGDLDPTEDLRFDPGYRFDAGFDPALHWANDNGFQGMAELCHGCGGCRGGQSTTGGVMCPTFRAVEEESLSTRGRANALRAAMSGDLPEDEALTDTFHEEILDLCIGCKGCARDCPSEVDMAKLKTEVAHARHQTHGASLRDRAFARIHDLARLGSRLAPASNWVGRLPGVDRVAERLFGIARERPFPRFATRSLPAWFADRGPGVPRDAADHHVLLFPDTFTAYSHPATGIAAVRVLEAAGVHVTLPEDTTGSGRPPYSKGFVDLARDRAAHNVAALAPRVRDGWDVVVAEPSDAVMLQSDYLDLLDTDAARDVAAATFGVCEYLDTQALTIPASGAGALTYHGHCHQKAVGHAHHAATVLETVGYDVATVDSTCCGMAGSFGYEAEHYSMSQSIKSVLEAQLADRPTPVVAPGTSCRTQLADRGVRHPLEVLAAALE